VRAVSFVRLGRQLARSTTAVRRFDELGQALTPASEGVSGVAGGAEIRDGEGDAAAGFV